MKTGTFAFKALTVCIALLNCIAASADSWYTRFDDAIRRFLINGMDTTYVIYSANSWEVPMALNSYGQAYRLTLDNGETIRLESGEVHEAGIGIGYHGLDYVQTFALSGKSLNKHFEFNFYDNAWGLQIINSEESFDNQGLAARTLILSGYIAFNGSRFSYPAAYYGNYIQKRSAGSPMIYFWYDHGRVWDLGTSPATLLSEERRINDIAVCGGYAYNWAFNGGKTVINVSGAAGIVAPYWGGALELRAGFMHWLNKNLRISLVSTQYGSMGWQNGELFSAHEWLTCLYLTWCFGIR